MAPEDEHVLIHGRALQSLHDRRLQNIQPSLIPKDPLQWYPVEMPPASTILDVPNVQPFDPSTKECICDECMDIYQQMQSLRMRLTSNNNQYGSVLAPLTHIRPRSTCTMCQFFYEMRWVLAGNEPYFIHAFSAIRLLYGRSLIEYRRDVEYASADVPCFAIIPESKRVSTAHALKLMSNNSFFMATQTSRDIKTPKIFGCRVNPESINYTLIQQWITQCASKYACGPKTGRLGTTVALYFVDCETRSIVQWRSKNRVKYVALSYVWGDTMPKLSKKDHLKQLPDQCPAVIEDAIVVTKMLGIRYLWVDCFCVSWDPATRHKQIARMDLVYKHSEVTIIAATGNQAEQGLPGVRSVLRRKQPCVQVRDEMLVSTLPSLESIMETTAYNKRGWTYQEAFFSLRQLIFTHDQIYFRCPRHTTCESIHKGFGSSEHGKKYNEKGYGLNDKYLQLSNLPKSTIVYQPGGTSELADTNRWTKPPTLAIFEHHVHKYTDRKLSYECDSLGAVQSILDRFAHEMHSIEHICGVPFIPNDDITYLYKPDTHNEEYEYTFNFFYGLLWTHGSMERPTKRRKHFPSWSWAGWEGSVSWLIHDTRYDELDLESDPITQPHYIESVQEEFVKDSSSSALIPCSKWRTRAGHQFPSTIHIAREWVCFNVVKGVASGSGSDAFYLNISYMHGMITRPVTNEASKYMVHLTLPVEATMATTNIQCLGTEVASNKSQGIAYLLLVHRPGGLVKKVLGTKLEELYERLGVAIVDTDWYSQQQSRHYNIWLG
jgi:hypothetical protein